MGAIYGIWHLDESPANEKDINLMKNLLVQYGRDAQDFYIDKNLSLGSCLNKVSIYSEKDIPVYVGQNQKTILAADAQIYNRDELIYDYGLTDNKLISNNELIMEAYKRWGKDCPKYINGDFAFAIWEREKNQIIIVRDHLGVRPIYYYYNSSVFVFATDYRAILALPFIPKKVNEAMLYKLLKNDNHIERENTFFEGIKKLPQAHILSIDRRGAVKSKYWSPGQGRKIVFGTEEEYFKALYDVVSKAVISRINNTKLKIGGQMSGGLDSSVINILANRELIKSNKKLALFSWSPSFQAFKRQPRDERNLIEQVCQQEGLECSYYDVDKDLSNKDMDKDTIAEIAGVLPFRQELENMSAKDIRLVLTGWGGDQGISHRANLFELFVNGYFSYFLKEVYSSSGGSLLRFTKSLISNSILPLFKLLTYSNKNKLDDSIINKDFYKSMKRHNTKKVLYFNIDPVKHIESGNIQTRTEVSAWIGSEYNIQYLFPFLDYNVVDFALSIPGHMYYKRRINRYVYRKAFEKILPEDLYNYVPKDDIARLTYSSDRLKENRGQREISMKKLRKDLFSKYIDFDKAEELMTEKNEEETRTKTRIERQINICCNIQKLILKDWNK